MILTRRQFLKMSAGTIAGLTIAEKINPGPTGALAVEDVGTILTIDQERYPESLVRDPGVVLKRDPTRLLLAFPERQNRQKVQVSLERIGLVLEDHDDAVNKRFQRRGQKINHTDHRLWIRSGNGKPITQETVSHLEGTLDKRLDWIGGVYRFPGTDVNGRLGLLCPIPNVLLIKPAPDLSASALADLAGQLDRLGLMNVEKNSRYTGAYRFYALKAPKEQTVYALKMFHLDAVKSLIQEVHFSNMPMLVSSGMVPNDQYYGPLSGRAIAPQGQWNMWRIQAGSDPGNPGFSGWDITMGDQNVIVWLMDKGCDYDHQDLRFFKDVNGALQGIQFLHLNAVTTILPIGSLGLDETTKSDHGTWCAGVAAARTNNGNEGVAGVAGNCSIIPITITNSESAEVKMGLHYAAETQRSGILGLNVSARVLSLSQGVPTGVWDKNLIDPAIQDAYDAGIVICAATMNAEDASSPEGNDIYYPANNLLVMACGASDKNDSRVSRAAEYPWGSKYGPEMSVVAPGINIPTTDLRDDPNDQNSLPKYASSTWGTSLATPHVAGLAALLISKDPNLTNEQVRNIIERTADKVPDRTLYTMEKPNGAWYEQMGYGRINVLKALEFADVLIKDWAGDTGIEPSSPPGGDFWDSSDIVIRPTDDGVFLPDNQLESRKVVRGQDNYLYVRVTNNGPNVALNVQVNTRITPYVGTEFVYPADWTSVDSLHVSPAPLTSPFDLDPTSGVALARFKISAAQVETLWGWTAGANWHPCLLAEVNAENDYAFANALTVGERVVIRRNNFAQSNLSVVEVQAGSSSIFPFIVGNKFNMDKILKVLIALERFSDLFPPFPELPPGPQPLPRIRLSLDDTPKPLASLGITAKVGKVSVEGGKLISKGEARFVEIAAEKATVTLEREPKQLHALALQTVIPQNAKKGQKFVLKVSQRNQAGETVGGATVVYVVT